MDQPTFKKTVLIVDDEPSILTFISSLLLDGNYCVLTAKGGLEALQKSIGFKGEIHLLLSDCQMPGMTGVDLATRLVVSRPDLKVLLMSGYPNGTLALQRGWPSRLRRAM